MRGFLHQLAARSLGLAPQIKTRVALPYAAPAADTPAVDAGEFAVPPASRAEATRRHELPASDTARGHHDVANPLPAPPVAETVMPSASAEGQAIPLAAATPGDAPPRRVLPQGPADEDRQAGQPTRRRLDAIASPATAELAPTHRQAQAAPAPATRQGEEHPRHPRSHFADLETLVTRLIGSNENSTVGQTSTAPLTTVEIPMPMPMPMPTPARAHPVNSRGQPGSQERPLRPAAEAEQATEVHITIGRLEVSPASRPTPPPPPRLRGPAPLSLTDYLARRKGGQASAMPWPSPVSRRSSRTCSIRA